MSCAQSRAGGAARVALAKAEDVANREEQGCVIFRKAGACHGARECQHLNSTR
jgi:hypothetical protein